MNTKGNCLVCGKETEIYCESCKDFTEGYKALFCDEHYEKIVLTGNCCRGSEELYGNLNKQHEY